MTPEERATLIASYGRAHDLLLAAAGEFPREMWQFRPSPDQWTIHEIFVHVTDSEANSYVRCRRFIAEPGKDVMAYDEMGWAAALRYHDQSVEQALELFRCLRGASHALIQTLPESAWSHTVYHPENGTMTMDDWLRTYERHVPEHVAQMRSVYEAWRRSR